MDVNLNTSLSFMNISGLMSHISMFGNNSEKIEKLNIYAKELNAEIIKLKEFKYDSPLCILVLTEAIQNLQKEIFWYTNMKADAVTHEFMPLKSGDSKEAKRQEKSDDADKKNWMSSFQLGSNNVEYDTTKKNYASRDSSSELIREDIAIFDNSDSRIYINSRKRKSTFELYQKPSSVVIHDFNANNGQHSSVGAFRLSSCNKNFSNNFITNLTYQHSLIETSKKPRLSWTHDLHREFLRVVEELGGPAVATPKQIKKGMEIDNLTTDEIKSHLQKYRYQFQKQYLASTPALAAPSTSKSSLIGQGSQEDRST
ncbi:transcription factor HHO2-like [Apium graveolens]|uniref:transcription factor HHO2-like n=1 Tax=Apium graveolens TaxID=4045 RepID=UPI003D7B6D22